MVSFSIYTSAPMLPLLRKFCISKPGANPEPASHKPNPEPASHKTNCKLAHHKKTFEDETRRWADLPGDLLSLIADQLGLIDLISFRSVCKQWKSASSTSTALTESSPGKLPWFLVHGETGSPCRLTTGTGESYAIQVPELEGVTCLASSHGWLLVLSKQGRLSSIFFLCPFSRARIDLPKLPSSEDQVAAASFSSPPWCGDCAVAVMRLRSAVKVEIDLIRRREEKWTALEFTASKPIAEPMICATFCDGSFYFFDSEDGVMVFSLESLDMEFLRIAPPSEKNVTRKIPFQGKKNYSDGVKKRLGLLKQDQDEDKDEEDDAPLVTVSTCGTSLTSASKTKLNDAVFNSVIFNEKIKWRSSGGESNGTGRLKGVWIHPRFFQLHKHQIW